MAAGAAAMTDGIGEVPMDGVLEQEDVPTHQDIDEVGWAATPPDLCCLTSQLFERVNLLFSYHPSQSTVRPPVV